MEKLFMCKATYLVRKVKSTAKGLLSKPNLLQLGSMLGIGLLMSTTSAFAEINPYAETKNVMDTARFIVTISIFLIYIGVILGFIIWTIAQGTKAYKNAKQNQEGNPVYEAVKASGTIAVVGMLIIFALYYVFDTVLGGNFGTLLQQLLKTQ